MASSTKYDANVLHHELAQFAAFEKQTVTTATQVKNTNGHSISVPTYINEFWTAKQRAAHSLHEISYRACFKPQLPRFFIQRLTEASDQVYDPFMGRGTTILEAALNGCTAIGCDINPLSSILIEPRLSPPTLDQVAERLNEIDFNQADEIQQDLRVFYHPETLREICVLRQYLNAKRQANTLDDVDKWIQMVALNRLTGHSPGFFSVYTMPPNQAVSLLAQKKINTQRKQTPPRRQVPQIILTKTRTLLKNCGIECRNVLAGTKHKTLLLTGDCENTPQIQDQSVQLVVTSPPFLDVVDYASDNWLRGWFIGIDSAHVPISIHKRLEDWQEKMARVFVELHRVLKPNGYIAFEVGEVKGGKILLEETVIRAATSAGLEPVLVLINSQKFTKTANTWGVANNAKGTNTNRIVLLRRA